MWQKDTLIPDREHARLAGWPAKRRALGELARWDRPIGTWLLFWPCAWGVALATLAAPGTASALGTWLLLPLFGFGAFMMRGAGCTINDLVDRDLDGGVARTATRPLTSGRVSVRQALAFLVLQLVGGLCVLPFLNLNAVVVAFMAMPLVIAYPFMKRITWWPQAFLGLTFNWGILVGWTAVYGSTEWPMLVLYAAGIFWTLGYDTLYAHQDKEDDALVGIMSTARLFGKSSILWVGSFYLIMIGLVGLAALLLGASTYTFLALTGVALLLRWQLLGLNLDNPESCLRSFRMNREVGLAVFASLLAGHLGS